MHFKKIIFLFFLTPIILFPVSCKKEYSMFNPKILKKSITLKNNVAVQISVVSASFNTNNNYYEKALYWGTDRHKMPETYIKEINIKFRDKNSFIRHSAFSDLMNIEDINIKILDNGFSINMTGGRDGTLYYVIIYFDNDGFLTRRRVFSPCFKDEVWEETKYSFIRRKDM